MRAARPCRPSRDSAVPPLTLDEFIARLPKAELHVHLEGSIEPATVVELASRHGVSLNVKEAAARYAPGDFSQFIESFKWVTSFLRNPNDYALIAERLAESLRRQNVFYAEVTLSVGVMFWRKQDPAANFTAIEKAVARVPDIRVGWAFDCVRQFGAAAAMEVARLAGSLRAPSIVAFGMGGDELAMPATDFRRAYEFAAGAGLHRLVHAGEIGGADSVREAVEILGAERIGHGIGAMHHERTMDFLAARGIPLEICPTSNLRTGALARQLGIASARVEQHPLFAFFRRGVPVTLSTDDPAMFETSLNREYAQAARLGLSTDNLVSIAESGFLHAFLPVAEKQALLSKFRAGAAAPGLV